MDQVMPVAAVEIEVSLQSYEQQTKDGTLLFPLGHSQEAYQYPRV